ncbi:MAG: TIM barrel protein [Ignavibacterium sp.]|nr:MAG: TIM barrel protein [Ignavibacterium sp.]
MDKSFFYSRRDFIKLTTRATLGSFPLLSLANSLFASNLTSDQELKIFIFSKHLQFLDYKSMCEAVKEMGFDGIDLTVRTKGHVLPENVNVDLPRVTEYMNTYGLLPKLITTKVVDANDPVDRKVIEVASQLGYVFYRTGWFKYSKERDIQESIQLYRERLKALAQLNKMLDISGAYQNHSGHYMGASLWDLDQVLEGISPVQMGCQYDIMHGTVEGGKNWEIDFRLIKDHINTLVVKDFKWGGKDGKWKPIYTQLGEGMVNFSKYFSLLKKYNINVPVSLHCEYDLGGAEKGGIPSIDRKEVFKKIKKDLLFLRETWRNINK